MICILYTRSFISGNLKHPCLNSVIWDHLFLHRCILGKRGKTIGVVQPMAIRASQNAAIAFAKDSPTAEKRLCKQRR